LITALAAVALGAATAAAQPAGEDLLPARVRIVVLHVPGGPAYEHPERRFLFYSPPRTQALWKPRFGTHWIVWTDGSIWPRHPRAGEARSFVPPGVPADEAWRRRVAAEAAPVYSHLHNGNRRSVGIEVAHSGRSDEPFPIAQVDSLTWLLETLLAASGGRLTSASIFGHKDLDPRPAYVYGRCERAGCPVYVDGSGRPFHRRVDPPEGLFRVLASRGLVIPRPASAGDAELRRAEAPEAAMPRRSAAR
jgi:hypothetical protein